MAEEDLLWSKRRHLFGGIEPSNMKTFSAVSTFGRVENPDKVIITAALPNHTIINGQVVCTVAGAVIRKSTVGYPKDEFDGEFLADIASDQVIYDDDTVDTGTYYYSAFPYSDQGVYNRSENNRTVVFPSDQRVFGYDLDTNDSDPATRVSYPTGCGNQYFTPAKMDTASDKFNYGDWPSNPGEWFMPKPCMLKYDGTVDYYLNPDDYGKKEDGTTSDVANASYGGNAMMEWPKIYTKRWEEDDIYHFRCSLTKIDDDYECWCNYDENDNEIDHFYTAIYDGSTDGKRARSLSGKTRVRTGNSSSSPNYRILGLVGMPSKNGTGWENEMLSDRLLVNDLLVMMYKTTDINSVTYNGLRTNASTTSYTTGWSNTVGMFYGKSGVDKPVKVFGMEGYWGTGGRFTKGLILSNVIGSNYNYYIMAKFTEGTIDGSTTTGYNSDGRGYIVMSDAIPSSPIVSYISDHVCSPAGRIPLPNGVGSSTTYECSKISVDYGEGRSLGIFGIKEPFEVDLTSGYPDSYNHSTATVALSYKPSAT